MTEYAPKGTVHHLIQAQKPQTLDESLVWKLMLQSTLGLHHIHQLKVLHRDIKARRPHYPPVQSMRTTRLLTPQSS